MNKILSLSAILLTTGFAALAVPVTPAGTFGTLSGATWGGTGIPNNAAMTTTIANGGNTITLGLSATSRYSNPALANNGAGIFYATSGINNGLTTPGHTPGATWNFDFYFDATGGNYTYKLFYGLDPASLLSFDPTTIPDNQATPNHGGQNSENLVYGFGDPNATGTYSFQLVAYDSAGAAIGQSAINVIVSSVPDAASTASLMGLGLLGLALYGRRKHSLSAAK